MRRLILAAGIFATLLTGTGTALAHSTPAFSSWTSIAQDQCTPATLHKWNIRKDEQQGPDPIWFVVAFAEYKRGCEILKGTATIYLQYRKKEGVRHIWESIPNAHAHYDMVGPADELVRMNLPHVNCTGTVNDYRMKVNFSPGEARFEGKDYPINASIFFVPTSAAWPHGIRLDCTGKP